MDKADGAFLTIGELSQDLGVAQHILRYWETRFPQLRPLQRSGNRRYYRPADVAVARRIHRLLTVEHFTVRGAQHVLAGKTPEVLATPKSGSTAALPAKPAAAAAAHVIPASNAIPDALIARLIEVRDRLAEALGAIESSVVRP